MLFNFEAEKDEMNNRELILKNKLVCHSIYTDYLNDR